MGIIFLFAKQNIPTTSRPLPSELKSLALSFRPPKSPFVHRAGPNWVWIRQQARGRIQDVANAQLGLAKC